MTDPKKDFERRERAVFRDFVDRHVTTCDPNELVSYSRSYRCDCGFSCASSGDVFDHTRVCSEP